jgi:hypothetical protein
MGGRYTAHSRSIFDDLSLGGSLLPSRTKCCVRHPGTQCLYNLPAFFLRSLPPALSVYIPVHLLAVLPRLPKLDLKTLVTDSLRSAAFLATCRPAPFVLAAPSASLIRASSCSYCLGAQAGCCAYFSFKPLERLPHPKIVYSGLAGALAGDDARGCCCCCAAAADVCRSSGIGLLVELPRRRTELSV